MRSIKVLSAGVALLIGLSAPASSASAAVAHYRYDHGYALNNLKVSPGTTFKVSVAAICRSGYAQSVRHVTEKQRVRVYAEYGIVKHPTGRYEIDHVIPLELGGNNAIRNLWPEPNDHPRGYLNSKDKLENTLHSLVCAHRVALVTAQKAIANDWVAAYHRFLGTWPKKTAAVPPTTTAATSTTKVTTTTAAATARVTITSLPSNIAPGATASLTAHSPQAHDVCVLSVILPSKHKSESAGLGTATANAQGDVSWTWKIGTRTTPGTATAIVDCHSGHAERMFRIT